LSQILFEKSGQNQNLAVVGKKDFLAVVEREGRINSVPPLKGSFLVNPLPIHNPDFLCVFEAVAISILRDISLHIQ
jgi:hypothetical protein